jgi:hypothetical protein
MTDILTELPSRQEDHSAPEKTADEESRMDTQTMDLEEPRPQLSIKQQCEKEDVNDKSCDIETLETPTTTSVTDGPIKKHLLRTWGAGQPNWNENTGQGNPSYTRGTKS